MKEHFIQRYEVLSTFPVTTPACAIVQDQESDEVQYFPVMTWAVVRERTFRQNGEELTSPITKPTLIEGIVRVGLYDDEASGNMVWTAWLACDLPSHQGYMDGVEP